MQKFIAGILIVLFFLLGGCVTAKQKALDSGLQPYTDQNFETFFSEEKIMRWESAKNNRSATVTFSPDGSISALGGDGKVYPGTYSVKDNIYCSKMDHRNGESKCSEWFKVDDKTFKLYSTGGSFVGTATIIK